MSPFLDLNLLEIWNPLNEKVITDLGKSILHHYDKYRPFTRGNVWLLILTMQGKGLSM